MDSESGDLQRGIHCDPPFGKLPLWTIYAYVLPTDILRAQPSSQLQPFTLASTIEIVREPRVFRNACCPVFQPLGTGESVWLSALQQRVTMSKGSVKMTAVVVLGLFGLWPAEAADTCSDSALDLFSTVRTPSLDMDTKIPCSSLGLHSYSLRINDSQQMRGEPSCAFSLSASYIPCHRVYYTPLDNGTERLWLPLQLTQTSGRNCIP